MAFIVYETALRLTGGLWGNSRTRQPRHNEAEVCFAKQMAAFVYCEITTFQRESAAQKSPVIPSVQGTNRTVCAISRVRAHNTPNTINMSYTVHAGCVTPEHIVVICRVLTPTYLIIRTNLKQSQWDDLLLVVSADVEGQQGKTCQERWRDVGGGG